MDLATYVSTYGPQPVVVRCEGPGGRRLPDAAGETATITFASMESAAGRAGMTRLIALERDGATPTDTYTAVVELLATLATGWTLPLPFDGEAVRTVLREIGWVADVAFATLKDDRDFFTASETP